MIGKWVQLAGAACLGFLALGGGYFAATSAQRESSEPEAPTIMAENSLSAANPTPVSLSDQTVSQLADAPLESESENTELAMEASIEPGVEDYAASMTAGRQGAKVREGPSRDAALIEHVETGTRLRVTGRTQASDHQWYRVVLRDRRSGFVREDVVLRDRAEAEDDEPGSLMTAGRAGANVRAAPSTDARLIVRVGAGSDLRAIGRERVSGRTWFRVVAPDGREGFVRDDVVE
jgi:hypothetical protein